MRKSAFASVLALSALTAAALPKFNVRDFGAKGDCVIRDSVRGINFSSTWFPSRGCSFRDITLENVDVNGTVEVMNVEGFRLERSTLRRMDLTPREIAERDEEIERFDTLLY